MTDANFSEITSMIGVRNYMIAQNWEITGSSASLPERSLGPVGGQED